MINGAVRATGRSRLIDSRGGVMAQGVFALLGILLLVLAALGVTAGRVNLTLLGVAFLAVALFWAPLSALLAP